MQKAAIPTISVRTNCWFKPFLVMKMIIVFTTVFCLQGFANGYSQNTVTLNVNNKPIKEVLQSIQQQTGYSFLYHNSEQFEGLKVNLNVANMPVKTVIEKLFDKLDFNFKITSNKLVLIQPDKTKTAMVIEPVTGIITDEKGQVLEGVSVSVKGKTKGTLTNEKGWFSIDANIGDVLVFSMIGMQTLEVKILNNAPIAVVLNEATNSMQEIVVVGYGSRKREEVTGAISSVRGTELTVAPVSNVSNALAGRLSGLVAVQSSGQPGYDQAKLEIRGYGNPLIIVDGVEGDFTTLDPNTIESISVLKDASASIYGARAGNGVILVTTKRGLGQKPVINVNTALTWQGITTMPKPVTGGQFAELSREQHLQSGQPEATAPFTEEQVKKYYEGTDPQYPNTNWYKEIFRDWAPQQQHNISVRGGSENIKYYGFLGMLDQQTMFKTGGGSYRRYNLISNIDAKISDQFSFLMNLSTNYGIKKSPWRGLSSNDYTVWEDYWNTQPVFPAKLPDPTKLSWAVGSNTGGAHIMGNRDIAGYRDIDQQNIAGTVALMYNSKFLKGLSAKALFNFNQDYSSMKHFVRPLDFYTYDYNADIYTLKGSLGSKASISVSEAKARILTGQFSLGYDKKFGLHQISALALNEVIDYYSNYLEATRRDFLTPLIEEIFGGSTIGMTNDGRPSVMGRKSYVGRISYNYDTRYLMDLSLRADGSAKFPKEKRWGYFPGVTLAWRVNKENFMSSVSSVDDIKLRASYGTAGNDGVGNFQYLSGFKIADDPLVGMGYSYGGVDYPGIVSLGLANPGLTWETIKTYNLGLDFSIFKRTIYGNFDVFYRERDGILGTRLITMPAEFGAALPPENLNKQNNRGFELKLGTAGDKNAWSWDVNGNISWTRAKWMYYEEPNYTDSTDLRTKKLTGRWTDVVFGYKSDGLFMSQAEIDNLGYNQDLNPTKPNSSLRPGDIKYVDVNKDGVIDRKDVVELGKGTTPRWMFGLNGNVRYKSFDLSVLFQGAFGYYNQIRYFGGVYPDVVYNERWTSVNTNRYALIPRLGGKGLDRLSDYNYKRAGYMRLKTFAFGYTIPQMITQKAGLQQVRAYIAAVNLFTFDRLKKYSLDPESPSNRGGHYYPQQKTISLGLNVTF